LDIYFNWSHKKQQPGFTAFVLLYALWEGHELQVRALTQNVQKIMQKLQNL